MSDRERYVCANVNKLNSTDNGSRNPALTSREHRNVHDLIDSGQFVGRGGEFGSSLVSDFNSGFGCDCCLVSVSTTGFGFGSEPESE